MPPKQPPKTQKTQKAPRPKAKAKVVQVIPVSAAPVPKRAKAKKKSGSRMRHAFNPTNSMVPPSLTGDVGVVPLNVTRRQDIPQTPGKSNMIVASAMPGYGCCAAILEWTVGSTTAVGSTAFTFLNLPVAGDAAGSGGPTSTRFTKVGLRLTNSTPQLRRGGRVYVVHIPQRMRLPAAPAAMTGAQWDVVGSLLTSYPETGPTRCEVHDWAQFGMNGKMADKPIYCRVNDEAVYHRFLPHQGIITTADNFFDNIASWTGSTTDTRSMTTVVVFWSTPASGTDNLQELTVNADAQLLSRWPLETAPSYLSVNLPPAPPKAVMDSRNPKETGGMNR